MLIAPYMVRSDSEMYGKAAFLSDLQKHHKFKKKEQNNILKFSLV